MDLLEQPINSEKNHLPKDGIVNYSGRILSPEKANFYLKNLLESIEWRHDKAVMFGKEITTKREVAWYGDKPFEYTYSNTSKYALPWTKELLNLKSLVEEESDET